MSCYFITTDNQKYFLTTTDELKQVVKDRLTHNTTLDDVAMITSRVGFLKVYAGGSLLGQLFRPTALYVVESPSPTVTDSSLVSQLFDSRLDVALRELRQSRSHEAPDGVEAARIIVEEANDSPRYPKNPLDVKTSAFEPKEILFNDGEFVIALGIWEGNHIGVGCRWHSDDGSKVGYPNGFGHPQWMNLPVSVGDVARSESTLYPNQISLIFRGIKSL